MVDEIRSFAERVGRDDYLRCGAEFIGEQVEILGQKRLESLVLDDVVARGQAHDQQQKKIAVYRDRNGAHTFSSRLLIETIVPVSASIVTTL